MVPPFAPHYRSLTCHPAFPTCGGASDAHPHEKPLAKRLETAQESRSSLRHPTLIISSRAGITTTAGIDTETTPKLSLSQQDNVWKQGMKGSPDQVAGRQMVLWLLGKSKSDFWWYCKILQFSAMKSSSFFQRPGCTVPDSQHACCGSCQHLALTCCLMSLQLHFMRGAYRP